MERRRPGGTIQQVAQHLGLAKGTVSRALNNYSDISSDTRDRILAAVDELGYRPSSTARRLKSGRVETVGIVLPVSTSHISDPFLAEFLDGVSEALGRHDMDLLVTTARDPTDAVAVFERLIAAAKVDGFIVTRTLTDDPRISFLVRFDIPFVAHGRTADPSGYAWLDVDNEGAFAEAVGHLAGLGHKRVGFVGGPAELNLARLRRDGYERGLGECGLECDPELEVEAAMSEQGGFLAAEELLALARPPTALLCATDALAIGAVLALRKAGLTVGRDVSVVGYDGVPVAAHIDPPITTLAQSTRDAGERVAEMLMEILERADPVSLQEITTARLVRRASDGPPTRTPEELRRQIDAAQQSQMEEKQHD